MIGFFRRTGLVNLSKLSQQVLLTCMLSIVFDLVTKVTGYKESFDDLGVVVSVATIFVLFLLARFIIPTNSDRIKTRTICINCGTEFPIEEKEDPDTEKGITSWYGQCNNCSTLWRLMDGGKE